jgi:hypothetical protein
MYAAARTIPLAVFALGAIYKQATPALLILGALAGAMQLLDAGIGLFEHDLGGKCTGPLSIVKTGLKLVQDGGGKLAQVNAGNGRAEGVSRPAWPPSAARFSLETPEHSLTLSRLGQWTSVGPPKWPNSKPALTLYRRAPILRWVSPS